ncbi:MAG: FemAB family XrtA/PEP-CTERM system-associated protein [Sphingobium sp.]
MLAGTMTVSIADLNDAGEVEALEQWIAARPESTPFHRPAWIMAAAQGTRQRAFMLVARRGGAIMGIVPLVLVGSPLFGRALVSSGFAVGGGIVAEDANTALLLADGCWRLAQEHRCATAELRGGMMPGDGWTFSDGTYLGFAKRLEADDDAQLLAVPRKHRAEIRKGLENRLEVEIGNDPRMLDIHYRLYAENVHRLGTPVFPKALFERVLSAFGRDADITVVSRDGVPHSSIFSLYHHGVCLPYWQGATLAARTLRSNEVGYFRLMGHARKRGCGIFDFGRSKVGTGPAAWKKSWGWEGTPLTYALRSLPGHEPRDINPLSPQYRRKVELWKKLPLPLANLLGPLIARGLG